MEKNNLLKKYLDTYTDEDRFSFINLVFNKKNFSKYISLINENENNDYYITESLIRNELLVIINKTKCDVEDFTKIFNMLSIDQILYIGY